MATILSIQSHVAYGYVGNKAAVFPLQRMGHEVIVINTVQFSNHTGYGQWQGDVFSIDHIQSLFEGLAQRGALQNLDAVLSGYLGDASLGQVILNEVKALRVKLPNLLYCCDPVMGDPVKGCVVRPGVREFFRDQALQTADILTPNQFELGFLVDHDLTSFEDILKAVATLFARGVKIILLTSLNYPGMDANYAEMAVFSKDERYRVRTPKLALTSPPNGSGDLASSLFLGRYLHSGSLAAALQHTAAGLHAVLSQTVATKARELQIISVQDELVYPTQVFDVETF